MARKLIHSIRALSIAFGLLTTTVLLVALAPAPGAVVAREAPSAIESDQVNERTDTVSTVQPQSTAVRKAAKRKRAQQAMALPYFSFAQGMRRGKGS